MIMLLVISFLRSVSVKIGSVLNGRAFSTNNNHGN